MNKNAEKIKAPFSPCNIEKVSSPLEPCNRHTAEHENRFVASGAEKPPMSSAMQNYNSNM